MRFSWMLSALFLKASVLVLAVVLVSGDASATPSDRVEEADSRQRKTIQSLLQRAGAANPPREVFIRAFKKEAELELWARSNDGAEHVLIERFPLCKMSGTLGPKSRQGDKQIPEGFYTVDRLNPRSRFHLSLGIDYPNALDTARARGKDPGDNIFIHGECFSVGCLSIGNDAIERVYLIASQAIALRREAIPVHIFPCRFGDPTCEEAMRAVESRWPSFYRALREGYAAFEAEKKPPSMEASASGYRRKE